jgi:hypothetical protein
MNWIYFLRCLQEQLQQKVREWQNDSDSRSKTVTFERRRNYVNEPSVTVPLPKGWGAVSGLSEICSSLDTGNEETNTQGNDDV